MNELRKAAELALEALESWQKTCLDCGRASDELGRATAPIKALHQALSQLDEVLAEREACARVCEKQQSIEWVKASLPALIRHEPSNIMAKKCAAAIRARG